MKKLVISLFVLTITSSLFFGNDGSETSDGSESSEVRFETLSPKPEHRKVSQLITHLLVQQHYQKKKVDDAMSSEIFDRYIDRLDGNRFYFLESDVQSFEQYRYMFDDFVRSGQVEAAFDIFNVYQNRVAERLEFVFKTLETDFDFEKDEYLVFDREELPWAKTSEELDQVWRKRVKNAALNLKIAGKEDDEIAEVLRKRYQRIQKNVAQSQSEDVFQVVMNAFAESFDPHTNYFSPKDFDDFKIKMSQSLEGIGARLSNEEDYTKVVEIVAGGPADKGRELQPNDRIIGVGQGYDGELVDVIGWRLDDVVQLIRGKKQTVVRLQVLAANSEPDALPDTISIVRDKIKLEDQSVSSEIISINHEGQDLDFGVITIPTFYLDYDAIQKREPDYKSTSRDTKKLLEELKTKNVDGVIIDLRRNGGGYLPEAVALTGLFIETGPVVQVKSSDGRVETEWDEDPEVTYDGPLAVLVDRLSASASEIFAAAIQDYDRGIIIGGQSYGKGTVQRPIDLKYYMRNTDAKLGQIKLTIAKFYRIDGRSTQHVGVTPDITFPNRFNLMEIGESTQENALLWDEIPKVQYNRYQDLTPLIPQLDKQHQLRLAGDPEYQKLVTDLDEYEANQDKKQITLNEARRRAERDKENKDSDKKAESDEEETEDKEKDRDLMLNESAHVLGDYILFSRK